MKFKLGSEYRVTFLDHFVTEDKSPEQAIKQSVEVVCWGRCVAVTKDTLILSHFWENDTSENNDNVHILKKVILSVKELK